jgi:hypothetical protein
MKRPVDIGLVPEPNLEEVGVQSDKALRAAPFLYTAQSQLPSPNFTRTFASPRLHSNPRPPPCESKLGPLDQFRFVLTYNHDRPHRGVKTALHTRHSWLLQF